MKRIIETQIFIVLSTFPFKPSVSSPAAAGLARESGNPLAQMDAPFRTPRSIGHGCGAARTKDCLKGVWKGAGWFRIPGLNLTVGSISWPFPQMGFLILKMARV